MNLWGVRVVSVNIIKNISDIPWHTNNENELIIPYLLDSPHNKQERNTIMCKDISSRFIMILITYSCL